MSNLLIQPLFDGPLDIIGDVHGEFETLQSLMQHLGYNDSGGHSTGRRLVFVGDLTDRGPDSPAVVSLVQRLVESGQAQCILGNHELNILLDHRKRENQWFYGDEFLDESGDAVPQVLADDATRPRVLDFFTDLPIALERADLRVVHAFWDDDMIQIAGCASDIIALYEEHYEQIEDHFLDRTIDEIDRGLEHQNKNPVKLLSSGPEERTGKPTNTGGKVRNERRVAWWGDYDGPLCVFGHYSILDGNPRGNGSTFCVDYGVGKRWRERKAGKTSGFAHRLAAYRFPESVIVFDNGDEQRCDI